MRPNRFIESPPMIYDLINSALGGMRFRFLYRVLSLPTKPSGSTGLRTFAKEGKKSREETAKRKYMPEIIERKGNKLQPNGYLRYKTDADTANTSLELDVCPHIYSFIYPYASEGE